MYDRIGHLSSDALLSALMPDHDDEVLEEMMNVASALECPYPVPCSVDVLLEDINDMDKVRGKMVTVWGWLMTPHLDVELPADGVEMMFDGLAVQDDEAILTFHDVSTYEPYASRIGDTVLRVLFQDG